MLENTQKSSNKKMDNYPLEELKPVCVRTEKGNMHVVREILLFVFGFVGFQTLGTIASIILVFINKKAEMTAAQSAIVNVVCYAITAVALIITIFPCIKKFFLKQFGKFKPYAFGIIGGAVLLAISSGYSSLLQEIGVGVNANETGVREIISYSPLLAFIMIVILGPLCEELTYRVGLFNLCSRKSRVLAYVVVTAVFALLHFNPLGTNIVVELLNLPDYLIAGFILCYLYDKFGLPACLVAHMLNNLIGFIGNL